MKTISPELEAAWADNRTLFSFWKVELKRRYYNGAAYVLESSATTYYSKDIDRVSAITRRVDTKQAGVRVSNVSVGFNNKDWIWLPSNITTGKWAPDATALLGYDPVKSEMVVYQGYKVADGSIGWTAMFTGLVDEDGPQFDSKSGIATFQLIGLAESKLKDANAQSVCTTLANQTTSPANGDGTVDTFVALIASLWEMTNIRFGAAVQVQGDDEDYTLDDLNDAEVPASIVATAGSIPGVVAILFNAKQWLRDRSPGYLIGQLCDAAGITAGNRYIEEPIFEGIDQSRTWQDAADWALGTLTNAEHESLDGWLRRRWFLFDDCASTAAWTSYATAITSSGGKLIFGGNSQNGPVACAPHDRQSGSWEGKVTRIAAAPYFMMVLPFMPASGTGYGFYINHDGGVNPNQIGLGDNNRSAIGSGGGTLVAGSEHDVRITLTPDPSDPTSGTLSLYLDDVLVDTATITIPASSKFEVWNSNTGAGAGDCIKLDDIYFSNAPLVQVTYPVETAEMKWKSQEVDLLAVPTAYLPLTVAATLNGGALAFATDAAATSGGVYDGEVAVDANNTPTSTLRQYIKLVVTSTVGSLTAAPEIDKLVLRWRGQDLFIKSADFTGMTCLEAAQKIAEFCGMEHGTKDDGTYYFRNRPAAGISVMTLNQKNVVIEISNLTLGYKEVRTIIQVKYGKSGANGYYFAEYKAADAGEAAPTNAQRFGERPFTLEINDFLFSNDAQVADSIAQKAFEELNYPKRRARVRCRFIPHLEVSDIITISFHDSPLIESQIFGDPMQLEPAMGATNTLARDILMKVVGKTDDLIKGESMLDLEEVLS